MAIAPHAASPPKARGVTAHCGISACMVRWTNPVSLYANHKQTVVYRNRTNNPQSAALIASTTSLGHYDENLEQGPYGTTYWYWVAYENTSGVRGPFSEPVSDKTAADIDAYHDGLKDEIQESPLLKDLGSAITIPSYINDESAEIEDHLQRLMSSINEDLGPAEVDEYACSDERQQAMDLASADGYFATAIPSLWDGITPFTVDVSTGLPTAQELLAIVDQKARRIREALGYDILVAGKVRSLADLTSTDLSSPDASAWRQFVPPSQRLQIRCCHSTGAAAPWFRVILLPSDDEDQARYALIHELYHLLGFTHRDATPGVSMSPSLDDAVNSAFTRSTPIDMARLACIYD